ncbi:restriction endonuclease subunit S [Delftia sp. Lp-1]|uniref:restriction endonuclease subunit S n=1 Tax=Delftia sp. Lp-1 TaxID=682863 RepID=UPI001E49A7A7|nr:restriction endonuclease subunit S [Delftia sp. Lp-1]MCB4788558.1 restriction endonuclease subunit S [Delftia sp. Lp-1]
MSVANEQIPALPNGWEWVPIGETGEYINGFAFKPSHRDSSGLPIVRIQNLTDESKALNTTNIEVPADYKIDTGDMLMSWSATLDVFVWRRGPALVNQHIFKVVPDEGVISKKLLFYWLKQAIQQLQKTEHLHGSTMMHINRGPFMAHKVPLPPAEEQLRIVSKLEEVLPEVDAGLAELKAAQKKLTQYRQSLLKSAVKGALTEKWRATNSPDESGEQLLERMLQDRRTRWEAKQLAKFAEQGKTPPKDWQKKYPDPVEPDATDLPDLPAGWVWASVEQLGDVQLGRQRSPDKLKGISPTRYIRAANITEAGVDFSDVLEMDFSEHERRTFELQAGDVLLTEASGSPEHVGRPAIWPSVNGLYCFQNTVLRFQPKGINSEFSFYSFLAMQKLGVFRKLSGGVGINHLSAGKFSKLPMALPSSDEQVEIARELVAQFAAIDEQRRAIDLSLKQSTAQRQNILRAAFAGELVPQDPNEEPASVLLERIRAEREERARLPKTRKTKQQKEIATVVRQLIDVLAEAGEWVPAQEAFRRCGVADGALTERIEELYAELRKLDKDGRLAVEAVTDAQDRKLYDKLKLLAG